MVSYVIGVGWWCDGTADGGWIGSYDFQRMPEFSQIWYHFVNKYTKPKKIIMIDNCSPLKPMFPKDDRIEILKMDRNYHHVRSGHPGLWCGQMRGIMLQAFYALMCDADYFVFIEQDCLVRGENWVEKAIDHMKKHNAEISYGWKDHDYKADHTIIIVKNSAILDFIRNYALIEQSDYEVRPELKYLFVHKDPKEVSHFQWAIKKHNIQQATLSSPIRRLNFVELPFPYGAVHGSPKRNMDFTKPIISAQQWSKEELIEMLKGEGLTLEQFTKGKEYAIKGKTKK